MTNKIKISKNNLAIATIIADVLEIYTDAGIPENLMRAALTEATIPGHEGHLASYNGWTKFPTKHRVPLANSIAKIAELAYKWRFESDDDLLFPQRLIKAQGKDYIRPAVDTTRYLVRLLSEKKTVTITKPTDFEPYTVTIRVSGYPDKVVLYNGLLLATIALVIQIASGPGSKPDELVLYT